MNRHKLNDEEMSALLEAFSDARVDRSTGVSQSTMFKLCVVLVNIYILFFITTYILLRENLIVAINPDMLDEKFLTVFHGRAYVMFWLWAAFNISLYFNLGFRLVALSSLIYVLNSTVDSFFVFHESFNFTLAPYFSAFIATRPLFILALIVIMFLHKTATAKRHAADFR